MKRTLATLVAAITMMPAFADLPTDAALPVKSIAEALATIRQNNASLKATRLAIEAQKIENKTDIGLENPEVGFNYLWGKPETLGKRKDFSVSQSLDVATLTGSKRRVANRKNTMLDCQYEVEEMAVLLEANYCLIDLVYSNAMVDLQQQRLRDAEKLAQLQKALLDKGESNLIEWRNVQMSLATTQSQYLAFMAEREALQKRLVQFNGGQPLTFTQSAYEELLLPKRFEEWYASVAAANPMMAYAQADVEASRRAVSLSRQEQLPSLSVGYMSEKVEGEHFRGLTFGLSVPLWNSRNKVKQAKAEREAALARQQETSTRLQGELEALYRRTIGLKQAADLAKKTLKEADNTPLLQKALEAGEISLAEYLQAIALVYDCQEQAMAAERDCQKAYAELTAYVQQ